MLSARALGTEEEWMIAKMVCPALGHMVGKGEFYENEKD